MHFNQRSTRYIFVFQWTMQLTGCIISLISIISKLRYLINMHPVWHRHAFSQPGHCTISLHSSTRTHETSSLFWLLLRVLYAVLTKKKYRINGDCALIYFIVINIDFCIKYILSLLLLISLVVSVFLAEFIFLFSYPHHNQLFHLRYQHQQKNQLY